jgi:hypothetical protein
VQVAHAIEILECEIRSGNGESDGRSVRARARAREEECTGGRGAVGQRQGQCGPRPQRRRESEAS